MPLLNLRELVQFPDGDNSSATIINGVPFNLTALNQYNYVLYSNGTLSNDSKCYLIFDNYKPFMFANGSFVNATTCYYPVYNIHTRGILSIIFGALFGITVVLTLANLKKHGRLYLREDKRFRVVGRRWQWYWMLFVAGCAMISTFTGVDIDRYFLQQIPIILQSFFFMLMVPGALAMVWEAVRHWGSWQERQIVDADLYSLPQDDRRARVEFWLPLVFYLFAWLNFFMVIPRSWTPIQKQNTPEQIETLAKPAATNIRGKAGALLACAAWVVIVFSLWHSMKNYRPRPAGFFNKITAFCRDCPTKLFLAILILAVRLAYGVATAWFWDLSVFQVGVQLGWPFGLGYAPILLIIIIFEIAGFVEDNEDRILIKQRAARGRMHDAELNITKKPNWWRNLAERYMTDDQRLRNMTTEVGGGRATTRRVTQNIEMGNMNIRNRSVSRPPEDPFRDQSPDSRNSSVAPAVGQQPPQRVPNPRVNSDAASTRTDLTGMTLTIDGTNNHNNNNNGDQPQQRIRSMLDV